MERMRNLPLSGEHHLVRDPGRDAFGAHLRLVPLDHDREAKPGVGTDWMMRDHAVDAETLGQQQLADVDIDGDVDSTHISVEIDLGVGRGLRTVRESVGQGHDLAEPHVGIIPRIRPCQAIRAPIVGETVALPPPSRRRSAAGDAVIATPRRTKPGSRFTIGSAGWSNGCLFSRAFTCFARVSMSDRCRPSGRRAGVRGSPRRTASTSMTTRASTWRTNRPTQWHLARPSYLPKMSDNSAMRRFRPRWISALLGGIVLPFDPVLGMVMLIVGLWRPKRKPTPTVIER